VNELSGLLQRGDIVIDGGNSMFKDDVRRAKVLQAKVFTMSRWAPWWHPGGSIAATA